MPDLKHHGVTMRRDPVNIPLADLVRDLRAGKTSFVRLEPGDATRYELVIVPNPPFVWPVKDRANFLLVTRCNAGPLVSILAPHYVSVHDVAPLSRGSQWTALLLGWWLRELWARLVPEVALELAPETLTEEDVRRA